MNQTKAKQDRELGAKVVMRAAGTFGFRIWFMMAVLVANVLLARWLGEEGLGTYVLVTNWVGVLSIPVIFGLDRLLIREVAVYCNRAQWGLLKGILRWATLQTLLIAATIMAVAAAVGWFVIPSTEYRPLTTFFIALIILPLGSLLTVKQSALRGLHRILLSQTLEMLVLPTLFMVLFVSAFFLSGRSLTSPPLVMSIYVACIGVCLVVATALLRKNMPSGVMAARPVFDYRAWYATALPFVLVSVLRVINVRTDILMIGAIKGAGPAAIYSVANRGAQLILVLSMALNITLSPTAARMNSENRIADMQPILTKSVRVVSLLGLLAVCAMIFFGQWYLLLNGKGFLAGKTVLVILSFCSLINVSMGLVGAMLNMTGNERVTAVAVAISAGVNVILNALFIPLWGIEGAAIATTTSTVVWNVILVVQVRRRLGIDTTVLGMPPVGRSERA